MESYVDIEIKEARVLNITCPGLNPKTQKSCTYNIKIHLKPTFALKPSSKTTFKPVLVSEEPPDILKY